MNEERQPLERETPRHTSSSNQDILRLSKLQQEPPVLHASSPNNATRGSQDISAQVTLFCIIYTNYNPKKWLARVKKPVIPWDKFKGLASKGGKIVSQEKRERENVVLVCICFQTRILGWLLIINIKFYL